MAIISGVVPFTFEHFLTEIFSFRMVYFNETAVMLEQAMTPEHDPRSHSVWGDWLEAKKRYSMLMCRKSFLILSHEEIPHGLFPLVSELLAGCLLAYRQDDWG